MSSMEQFLMGEVLSILGIKLLQLRQSIVLAIGQPLRIERAGMEATYAQARIELRKAGLRDPHAQRPVVEALGPKRR